MDRIKQRFEMLRDKLNQLTRLGFKVEVRNNRMVIRLPGDVLFPSGSDQLKPGGIKVLGAVAAVIRKDPQLSKRYFQVTGHTDNVPLQGGLFRDNWGLSLMRARREERAAGTTLQLLENRQALGMASMPLFSLENVPYMNPLGWSVSPNQSSG